MLAEAVALLHDIGRFPQYHRYRTFKDSSSVNHAVLGAELLARAQVLDKLPADEQDVVMSAVRLHNVFTIPPELRGEYSLHLKLIRDADKLDIWRVFNEFYRLPEQDRASAVSLGFPDVPECSPDVLAALSRRELVDLAMVQSLNDFKLLQLSWVYDLNFAASFTILRTRGYIDGLVATLPPREEVLQAIDDISSVCSLTRGRGDLEGFYGDFAGEEADSINHGGKMKRRAMSLCMVLAALLLAVGFFDMEAQARVGGGRSMGSRGTRSYSQPASPYSQPAPQVAPQPRPYSPPPLQQPQPAGGGFLRNMAGGMVGGMLGGMLFRSLGFGGGGMGRGGMGGSGIGLFEILLLAGIGYFIYRFVKKKRESEAYSQGGYEQGGAADLYASSAGLHPGQRSPEQRCRLPDSPTSGRWTPPSTRPASTMRSWICSSRSRAPG